ncbi:EAL domain-containing protein [Candidatus Soleaferrea massiliensis]|uniref:EAL domain-containing protein n=1 Tax=Candidatus Soleaferrea massiliensis TaxID=1470354 RepID=UPI00058DAC18|nr:EAL domain-containing protein [Candidatus Soleaferrea massiliensis]
MLGSAVFEIDTENGRLLVCNAGMLERELETGRIYPYEGCLRKLLEEHVWEEDRERLWRALNMHALHTAIRDQRISLKCDVRFTCEDYAGYRWVSFGVMLPHGPHKAVGSIQDIHEQKLRELEMQYQASHDPLTGLYSRAAFEKAVYASIEKPGGCAAFCIVNLDNFKKANEAEGHDYGDQVLAQVAGLLRENAPQNALIGHLGGDEFALFLPGVSDEATLSSFYERILQQVRRLECGRLGVSVSMGAAFYPKHGERFKRGFYECADAALCRVKETGRNGFMIYDPQLSRKTRYNRRRTRQERRNRPLPRLKAFLKENISFAFPIFVSILLSVVILAYFASSYISGLQRVIDNESYEYLHEISSQINLNITKLLDRNFATLDTLGRVVERNAPLGFEHVEALLERECSSYGFSDIALLDEDGGWHSANGQIRSQDIRSYYDRLRKQGKAFMSQTVRVDDTDCVIFFAPLPADRIQVGSVSATGLAAVIPIDRMNQLLPLTTFDNKGFAHIITSNGDIVVRSTHPDSCYSGYNLLSMLRCSELNDGVAVQDIRKDLDAGRSRRILYQYQEKNYLSIYMPLDMEDWYLFSVVPQDILADKTADFYQLTIVAFCVMSLLLFAMVVMTVSVQINRRRAVKEAYVDRVTGGRSKRGFESDAARTLLQKPGKYTMIYANIEHFKLLNDRLGWQSADEILKQIYDVFQADMGAGECAARLMADQFGILLATQNIPLIGRRIDFWNREIERLSSQHAEMEGLSVTYGLYPIDEPGLSVPLMLDRANLARRTLDACSYDGGCFAVYDQTIKQRMQQDRDFEKRQEKALQDGEFKMYLQPKYRASDGLIVGAEALVRWETKEQGIIYPDQFIPLFELNGFITQIDLFIFDQACRFLCLLRGFSCPPQRISVNLSRAHLKKPGFFTEYLTIWEKYDLSPWQLEFELTESLFFDNLELLNQVNDQIHSHGFKTSMDDFGSGYSSLNILKNVQIDVLKLDRELLHFEQQDSRAVEIIRSVVSMAHALDMEVVAEGVEHGYQVDCLKELECEYIQGYYYAKPQPAEEFLKRIAVQYRHKRPYKL